MTDSNSLYSFLLEKYKDKIPPIIAAHCSFLQTEQKFQEAKVKKVKFEKALAAMKLTEKRLDNVIPFVHESKSVRSTILGLAGLYDYFETQIKKADQLICMFEGNHEGPRNLFIFLLADIMKNDSGTEWAKVHEIILELKKKCTVTEKVFHNIRKAKDEADLKIQKELLRSASNRAKKYKFL